MIDMTPPPAVVEFAKDNGYDNAKYLGEWQNYKVFEPTFNDSEENFVGYPLSILVKDKEIRFTTEEECFKVLDKFSASEDED